VKGFRLLVAGLTFPESFRRVDFEQHLDDVAYLLSCEDFFSQVDTVTLSWQAPHPQFPGIWDALAVDSTRWNASRQVSARRSYEAKLRLVGPVTRFRKHLQTNVRKSTLANDEKRTGPLYTWRTRSLVEKHIRAWSLMLEGDYDFVLVLEDDARLKAHLAPLLGSEIANLLREDNSSNVFVDMCGHFPLLEIFPDLTSAARPVINHWLEIPLISNTAAAYMFGRQFAIHLHEWILAFPSLRAAAGVDALINFIYDESAEFAHATAWSRFPGLFENTSLTQSQSAIENT